MVGGVGESVEHFVNESLLGEATLFLVRYEMSKQISSLLKSFDQEFNQLCSLDLLNIVMLTYFRSVNGSI